VAEGITAETLGRHLADVAQITERHGGDRRAGSQGVDALREHVAAVLERAGYAVRAHPFQLDGVAGTNLLAERTGETDEVVMLGAHLDTVAGSPGLNDDGSGVAAVLAIAEALAEAPGPRHTIRLALWDAEEGGPFGSRSYVASLGDDERRRVRAYLNLDIVGSPNAVRFVYDEPGAAPGSAAVTARFVATFEQRGLSWDRIDLEGDSDHGPFSDAGIPTGGVFSGGIEPVTPAQAERHGATPGVPADACSHRPCDTLDNVDPSVAAELARAAAVVLVELAEAR
jgi:aminopeptidase S